MKFLILLISFISSTICFAEDALVARFRQAALNTIDEAQKHGETHIGGIELNELRAAVRRTQIVNQSGVTLQFSNRKCASWFYLEAANLKNYNKIHLNKNCAQLSDEKLKGLALHEILGANYKADLKYEITAPLLSRSTLVKNKVDIKTKLLRGGGSTGVGGGGDFDDLNFKILGLKRLEQLSASTKTFEDISLSDLAEALTKMDISAASDIEKFIEYRGPETEAEISKTYINSSLYRSNDDELLANLAVVVAALEIKYGRIPEYHSLPATTLTSSTAIIRTKVPYP